MKPGVAARYIFTFFLSIVVVFFTLSCGKKADRVMQPRKLQVVTSLFPLYDFAKNVGGDRADVSLLLPPGVEPHSFEPRPEDIIRLGKADIFIYTNKYMEPWVKDILKGINNPGLVIVDSSMNIAMVSEGRDHSGMDPHVWLDLTNAAKMVDAISGGIIKKDPANREIYQRNAESYKAKLLALDKKFIESLSNCNKRIFMSGGHYSFGYFAKRYNLQYRPAYYGFSPDAEPNPKDLIELSKELKRNGLHYIFYEELVNPAVARTIAGETGAKLLLLHGAHDISRDEMDRGVTFLAIMEQNLVNLRKGLECR